MRAVTLDNGLVAEIEDMHIQGSYMTVVRIHAIEVWRSVWPATTQDILASYSGELGLRKFFKDAEIELMTRISNIETLSRQTLELLGWMIQVVPPIKWNPQ